MYRILYNFIEMWNVFNFFWSSIVFLSVIWILVLCCYNVKVYGNILSVVKLNVRYMLYV